ncbi:MAG: outer membrane beta-barrel protein [Bdellovibrionales bacterium]|nr:outer membrane beta-barrel protein [Bdellovibrionales bacterium]
MRVLVLLTLFCLSTNSWAQSDLSSFRPDGINGSAGAGFAIFTVKAPDDFDIKIDQATYAYVGGEKGFDVAHLYLTVSFQYMTTTGQSNYEYESVSTSTKWEGEDVDFKASFFQAGLGLKLKIIDDYWFRPYVEGGGLGGYFQITYSNDSDEIERQTGSDDDPKLKDALLDFGRYVEGGLEIAFAETWGIKASARFIESETKKLETLGDRTLKYASSVYFLSLLKAF